MSKHHRRKVTQEQIDAMNRQLDVTRASYRYYMDESGRLATCNAVIYDVGRKFAPPFGKVINENLCERGVE